MTCETTDNKTVRLPKWFAVTILSGAVSFAGFAITVISDEAKEDAALKKNSEQITENAQGLSRNSSDISQIKTDIAVIRVQQEGTDKSLDRIEKAQEAILKKLSND
tara:strand:- start:282 stop:599 length:318 start_codon:yes stop_codon:yes gene_type:complete